MDLLEIKNGLHLSDEESIRVFSSLAVALYECIHGSLQLYSHRNTIFLHRGVSPWITSFERTLLRDSKKIEPVTLDSFEIKKEAAFLLLSADHPVTGQLLDLTEVEQAANQNRVLCLSVFHQPQNSWEALSKQISPYGIQLLTLQPEFVLVRLGARAKIYSLFSDVESVPHSFRKNGLKRPPVIDLDGAQKLRFQTALSSVGWQFWPENLLAKEVLFCSHPDVNSDWARHRIKSNCPPLASDQVEATSLCRWSAGPHFYEWWEGRPSDQFLRGGLILGPAAWQSSEVQHILIKCPTESEFVL